MTHYDVVRVSNEAESSFSWLRAKRGINFQEDIAVGFKKSQSSFPTDLHLAGRRIRFSKRLRD